MAERRLGQTLGSLALALVNATLLLAALCLWLAWGAMSAAERASDQIRLTSEAVLPLRDDIGALTAELAAARADIAALTERAPAGAANTLALQGQLTRIEAGVDALADAVAALRPDPEALIDRAVQAAFAILGSAATDRLLSLRREDAAAP